MKLIVVGATKGIGEAILKLGVRRDYSVIPMAREAAWQLDLTWPEERIFEAMAAAVKSLQGLDALVVSAGMGAYMTALPTPSRADAESVTMDDEHLLKLFRTNVIGRIHVYRACLKALLRSRGTVLFLGSTVSANGAKGLAAYGATMAAMEGFVKSEAMTLKRHRVRMNILAPGWVRTPMTDEMRPDYRKAAERFMGGRMLEPEEVAWKAFDVLGDDVTGQVIPQMLPVEEEEVA